MPLPTIETPTYELKLPSTNKKIKYHQINKLLYKFIKKKEFTKYKKIKPKKIEDIIFVKNIVSSSITNFLIKQNA